ncbi:hypothetical protein [Amycolatopsis thermophila]|uniref:Uncharacterized membrane protein YcaP (DUF421 family) n=1 Tax=Amycolatopsis thermophila TaxID=206084 RepID=A0ABU0F1J9_9PSEU|nr:hypothetical protein [Amycolatopsis thermophila]MDQ0381455.1 uncharacterized membrane protein YcaP (DUF421 family) [Amycolatopsis thermophila]
MISRLRFVPRVASVLDHPVRVLVVDGAVDHRQLKAAHPTEGDLSEALRERGGHNLAIRDAGTTLPDVR